MSLMAGDREAAALLGEVLVDAPTLGWCAAGAHSCCPVPVDGSFALLLSQTTLEGRSKMIQAL